MNYFFWPQRQWPNRIRQTPPTLDGSPSPFPLPFPFSFPRPRGRTTSRPWPVINFRSGRRRNRRGREHSKKAVRLVFRMLSKGLAECGEGRNPKQPTSSVQCPQSRVRSPGSISSYAARLDLMGFGVSRPAHVSHSGPARPTFSSCSLFGPQVSIASHRLDWLRDFRGICLAPFCAAFFRCLAMLPLPLAMRTQFILVFHFGHFFGSLARASKLHNMWEYLDTASSWESPITARFIKGKFCWNCGSLN